eukprot:gene28647-31817_t
MRELEYTNSLGRAGPICLPESPQTWTLALFGSRLNPAHNQSSSCLNIVAPRPPMSLPHGPPGPASSAARRATVPMTALVTKRGAGGREPQSPAASNIVAHAPYESPHRLLQLPHPLPLLASSVARRGHWASNCPGPSTQANPTHPAPTQAATPSASNCFKCGQEGHWASNCPGSAASAAASFRPDTRIYGSSQPGTQTQSPAASNIVAPAPTACFKCGKEGHWSNDCPLTKRGAGGRTPQHPLKLPQPSTFTCFKCGQEGHWASNCPGPSTQANPTHPAPTQAATPSASNCFKCGQEGHWASNCPGSAASAAASFRPDTRIYGSSQPGTQTQSPAASNIVAPAPYESSPTACFKWPGVAFGAIQTALGSAASLPAASFDQEPTRYMAPLQTRQNRHSLPSCLQHLWPRPPTAPCFQVRKEGHWSNEPAPLPQSEGQRAAGVGIKRVKNVSEGGIGPMGLSQLRALRPIGKSPGSQPDIPNATPAAPVPPNYWPARRPLGPAMNLSNQAALCGKERGTGPSNFTALDLATQGQIPLIPAQPTQAATERPASNCFKCGQEGAIGHPTALGAAALCWAAASLFRTGNIPAYMARLFNPGHRHKVSSCLQHCGHTAPHPALLSSAARRATGPNEPALWPSSKKPRGQGAGRSRDTCYNVVRNGALVQ